MEPADILASYNAAFEGDPGPPEPPDGGTRWARTPAHNGHTIAADSPTLADALLTRSALRNLPSPQPLIRNTLDQGTTALLYGKWGTAKTFIALDWALCVATGHPWQGRRTEQRRVLYIAAEGAFGFKCRVDAWETGWTTPLTDDNIAILPRPVNLTRPPDIYALTALVDDHGFDFIVLDTLARCMVGGDENSAKDCGQVVDTLHRLREATPAGRGVVLGVHHAGKDGKTLRGSSAFEAGVDTVYFTARDGDAITLERQKRKDGPEHDHHDLRIDPIVGTGSAAISRWTGGGQTDRADKLLSIFLHHFSATGATKKELHDVSELTTGTFYRALDDLVKRGELINEGTDKRPYYRTPDT